MRWGDQNKEKTSVKPKINNEFWQWEKQKSKEHIERKEELKRWCRGEM